jgi:hypothetical protein
LIEGSKLECWEKDWGRFKATFSKRVSMAISRVPSPVVVFFSSMSKDGEHLRSYIGWMKLHWLDVEARSSGRGEIPFD